MKEIILNEDTVFHLVVTVPGCQRPTIDNKSIHIHSFMLYLLGIYMQGDFRVLTAREI